MKRYAGREHIGSPWAIHAEGSIERQKYQRGYRKRNDIVIVDHNGFRRWWKRGRQGDQDYPLECAIEFKLTYGHSRETRRAIEYDIRKLDLAVRAEDTKLGYLVWFDGIHSNGPEKGLPFFPSDEVQQLRVGKRAIVVHWPNGDTPIRSRQDIQFSKPGFYPK